MTRRSRDRQLAKLAARRAAERKRKQRQRFLAIGVAVVVGAAGIGFGLFFLLKATTSKAKPLASGTPTSAPSASAPASPAPTATASASPSPSAAVVACGGTVPKAASEKKPTFSTPPPLTIDPSKTYTVTMVTSCGTIEITLFPKDAPNTVNSFVFLANQHFFDGLTFHRVIKDFVIQGGDPAGTGSGGPGYSFADELNNNLTYEIGTLAMANSGPDTNGSQFFIVTGPQGVSLPKSYTIFGKVTSGLDVATAISNLATDPATDRPVSTVYIVKVTVAAS